MKNSFMISFNKILYFLINKMIGPKIIRIFHDKFPAIYNLGTSIRWKSLIKLGDIVVQAGCDMGWKNKNFTSNVFRLSDLVGKTGLVLAIEPDPRNITELKKNINDKRIENIKVIDKALWDTKKKIKFKVGHRANDSQINEYLDIGNKKSNKYWISDIIVECDTIDNILKNLGIEKISHICLTINGAELEALRGSTKTLQNNNISLLIAASHDLRPFVDGISYREKMLKFLKSYGFKTNVNKKGWIDAYKV